MKRFSVLSIVFNVIGIIIYGINRMTGEYAEPFILFGFISLFITIILGFIAIARNETGRLKYISISLAFVVLGVLTWTEPFQIVRVMTWLKNA